jgi:hypothetical protein
VFFSTVGENRTLFERFIFGVECPLVSVEPLGMWLEVCAVESECTEPCL